MEFPVDSMDGPPLSDNDRLITVLQTCFAELARKQEEHAKKQEKHAKTQEEQADKLFEALKPKVPVTDRKTAFWNAYKNLADEHDKEFQQKYSTDLDTALIFAGLFSAISSAFIIQIQPAIQLHDTPLLILVAQCLLYVSLCLTLLAALLAVLGKQWLMYYSAAGERGTSEARGLERQSKLDGLRKWKFDTILQIFPLLLQFGLLVFAIALSVYLWTVQHALAIIVIFFTSFGFVAYTFLLLSAAVSPDSPFQNPLVPLISLCLGKLLLFFGTVLGLTLEYTYPYWSICRLRTACSQYLSGSRNYLPLFLQHQLQQDSTNLDWDPPTLFCNEFTPEPSAEVPAVSWVLETSTDPLIIDMAAEMVIDLQWSATRDDRLQLNRLRDGILECFKVEIWNGKPTLGQSRDGMAQRAIHLGQAYCALRSVFLSGKFQPWPQIRYHQYTIGMLTPELANVVQNLADKPAVLCGSNQKLATKWALRVIPTISYSDWDSKKKNLEYFLNQFDHEIPTLDVESFTDYLFCIYSFLSTISRCDVGLMDKSRYRNKLFHQIFSALLVELKTEKISMATAAKILETTAQLASKGEQDFKFRQQTIINHFCSSLPQTEGWIGVVLATLFFSEMYPLDVSLNAKHCLKGDTNWIYKALENFNNSAKDHNWDTRTVTEVNGLLNALLHYGAPPAKENLHLLVQVLSFPGRISISAALLLLATNWFQDVELRLTLQQGSVWSSLIHIASDNWEIARIFIRLGHTLASIPDWQPFIHQELCSWITLFFRGLAHWRLVKEYNSVLSQIWNPVSREYEFSDDNEKALGLTSIALLEIWEDLDFAAANILNKFVQMLRCTNWAVLQWFHEKDEEERDRAYFTNSGPEITPRFITAFSITLHDSLVRVVATIRMHTSTGNTPSDSGELSAERRKAFDLIVQILENIVDKMPLSMSDVEPEQRDWKYWNKLQYQLHTEINEFERSLK
ncbi:hypothetical protein DFH08DRAFT_938517 [Mycena albidolilacea]|uniref:DUF6535 domain-containing protein n=1 Tax=Mycena albidolilacea TaxID=1033008 RepID=A0AAD7ENV9_9AGAR|nr:hypothetical protein DFH08DRAFT_938517 [Mycena albidolilacea]